MDGHEVKGFGRRRDTVVYRGSEYPVDSCPRQDRRSSADDIKDKVVPAIVNAAQRRDDRLHARVCISARETT